MESPFGVSGRRRSRAHRDSPSTYGERLRLAPSVRCARKLSLATILHLFLPRSAAVARDVREAAETYWGGC